MSKKDDLPLSGDPHRIANALIRTFELWLKKQDITFRNANKADMKQFCKEFGAPAIFIEEAFKNQDKRDLAKNTMPRDAWDCLFFAVAHSLLSDEGLPILRKKTVETSYSGGSVFSMQPEIIAEHIQKKRAERQSAVEIEDTAIQADSITIKSNSDCMAEISADGKVSIKGDVEVNSGAKLKSSKPFKLVNIMVKDEGRGVRKVELSYEEKDDPELKKFEMSFPHILLEGNTNKYTPNFISDVDTGKLNGDDVVNWIIDKHYAISMSEHYEKPGSDLTKVMVRSGGVWKRWNIPDWTACPLVAWKIYPNNDRWNFRGEWNIGEHNELGLKHIIADGYIHPIGYRKIPFAYENPAWCKLEQLTNEAKSFGEDEMAVFLHDDFAKTDEGYPIKPLQYEVNRLGDGYRVKIVYGGWANRNGLGKPRYREILLKLDGGEYLYGRVAVETNILPFQEANNFLQRALEQISEDLREFKAMGVDQVTWTELVPDQNPTD